MMNKQAAYIRNDGSTPGAPQLNAEVEEQPQAEAWMQTLKYLAVC